jgi:hypothetical protein
LNGHAKSDFTRTRFSTTKGLRERGGVRKTQLICPRRPGKSPHLVHPFAYPEMCPNPAAQPLTPQSAQVPRGRFLCPVQDHPVHG